MPSRRQKKPSSRIREKPGTNGREVTPQEALSVLGAGVEGRQAMVQHFMESEEGQVVMREVGVTSADIQLALEDRGWIRLGEDPKDDPVKRESIVQRARVYWHHDPLAKHAVRLWTDFGVGTGMSFSVPKDPTAQTMLKKFWNARANRRVLGPAGQRKSSHRLLVDGEIFFLVFKEEETIPVIRRLEPLQVVSIHTHPDDDEQPVFYERRVRVGEKFETKFYLDWSLEDVDDIPEIKDSEQKVIRNWEQGVVMVHVAFDPFYLRGNSLLTPALNWFLENRRFHEARVSITQSLARFVWTGTVKGGQAAVDTAAARFQSTRTSAVDESNPPPAGGSMWWQNKGIDLQPFPRVTGGSEARDDGDALKLMISAGVGIFLHYFGDPTKGNLATATAMELPMRRQFEAYQLLWTGGYNDVFSVVLDQDDEDELLIDQDWPMVTPEEIEKASKAIETLVKVVPELADQPEILLKVVTDLGINNAEEVVTNIEKQRKEAEENAPDLPLILPPGTDNTPEQMAESIRRFREDYERELERRLP